MKIPKIIFASILMAASISLCSIVQAQTSPADPPPPVKVKAIPAQVVPGATVLTGWQRYQFGIEPAFSVILPSAPTTSDEPVAGMASATLHMYASTTGTAVYVAARLEQLGGNIEKRSDADRQTFFERFVDGFAKGFQESMKQQNLPYELKLLDAQKVTIAGRDGYQQELSVGEFRGRANLVFAGTGAFCLVSIWHPKTPTGDTDAFFNSLQLTGVAK
ncbi:MAG TPA: hypothetical protein VJT50_02765 [Pyrinomonadaceae bacterium]|nr:hypothetical protein [Pyrinomonadaceae bacterium]